MKTVTAATLAAVVVSGLAWAQSEQTPAEAKPSYLVKTGTRVPLALLNSLSTKHAAPGDHVYLESVFPVVVDGKMLIPAGSYVSGTVTQVKRPGRVKGRGEIFVRFDSMILPNGVTRDFRARVGGIDGRSSQEMDRQEGKITSEGNKSGDARTAGEAAAGGAGIGAIVGAARGRPGMGVGIGAAAGAAAGLAGVLLTRGPDAVLARGTQLDMVLDRDLTFSDADLSFPAASPRVSVDAGAGPVSQRDRGRRFPW